MSRKCVSILLTLCFCLVITSSVFADAPTTGAASCVAHGHTSFSSNQYSGWPIIKDTYVSTNSTGYYGRCYNCGGGIITYYDLWDRETKELWWTSCNTCDTGINVGHTHHNYTKQYYNKCSSCGNRY
jgi:hypothetical protein